MSTYQGIAATTWTLQYLAGAAARSAVPEANVTLDPPEQQPAASRDEPRLNIYLVQVVPNPALRSMDLPTRSDSGSLVNGPQVALNLRYLLSFFGPATKAHLMLGAVEIALREHAVFDAPLITAALSAQPDLQGSRLEAQSPPVHLAPKLMTLEELARFWSGFFQIPYALSTIYEASVVVIESLLAPTVLLPVRSVNVDVSGLAPQLEPFPGTDYAPGVLVPVAGSGLAAGQLVDVAGVWAPLLAVADGGLAFALPGAVPAGVHLVRLGRPGPPDPTGAAAPALLPGSEAQPLVVRPVVASVDFDPTAAVVSVTVSPVPGPVQTVVLSLVGLQPDAAGPPASVRLAVPSSRDTTTVSFRAPALRPGPYLVVVEVDGVASRPIFNGELYDQPQVQIA